MDSTDMPLQDLALESDQGAARHILIVEDEASTAEMLSAYFDSMGYDVSHVSWGRDAVDVATKVQPDLVILDIHLPDIDGYEVCMRLRDQTRTENTPIIFLTERKERIDRLTGLELGAVDYITKPFDVQELRFRVRNALRRSHRETLLHPVTGLPTSLLVREELARVVQDPDLALVGVTIRGMVEFSDAYGFVTHDDVLRAVALILRNTAAEFKSVHLFVGQLDVYQYIVVTSAGQEAYVIMGRLDQRLNEAASFFYPHRDWERGKRSDGSGIPRLDFQIRLIPATSLPHPPTLADLRQILDTPEA
ncbi:MAG: response regulator [Anaerolineae bacterium]